MSTRRGPRGLLTGEIRPGQRLGEAALAVKFKVSRIPLREALFQLAATGLVGPIPHRGAFAVEIGPQQLSLIFEVIAELEVLCARNFARSATAVDIAEPMDLHSKYAVAAHSGEGDAYSYAKEQFHVMIRAISGNSFLQAEVAQLQKRMPTFRRVQLCARMSLWSKLWRSA